MFTREAWQAIKMVTAPGAEPHTLGQARDHLRIDADQADDQADIAGKLAAARAHVEKHIGRALYAQRHRLTLKAFPCFIELPLPPLLEVLSVSYVDTAGETTVLDPSAYRVSADEGTITPALNTSWPSTAAVRDAVTVEWLAGYTDGIVTVPAEAVGDSGSTAYAGNLAHAPDFDAGPVTLTDGTQEITFSAAGAHDAGSDGTGTITAEGAYSVTFTGATSAAVTASYQHGPVAGDPLGQIPPPIKSAILLTLGDLYVNRENVVVGDSAVTLPFGAVNLLAPFRAVLV